MRRFIERVADVLLALAIGLVLTVLMAQYFDVWKK